MAAINSPENGRDPPFRGAKVAYLNDRASYLSMSSWLFLPGTKQVILSGAA